MPTATSRLEHIKGKSVPNFNRLLDVLRRRGRQGALPLYEICIDREVLEAVTGQPNTGDPWVSVVGSRDNRLRFYPAMGYDHIPCKPPLPLPDFIPRVGADTADKARAGGRVWEMHDSGPVQSWEDFEQYPFPKLEDINFSEFEYFAPRLPEGMMLTGQVQGLFGAVSKLMGTTPLFMNVHILPDLVQALFDRLGEVITGIYRTMASVEHVGALVLSDDLGFNTQTFISPEHIRRFVLPWHKKMAEACHRYGKPCILHCCGNIYVLMDEFIHDVRIDAKHSYQDIILPVTDAWERYGDGIAILGGVDLDVLCRAEEDELRRYIRKVLETCGGAGNYALGSGNTIANYVPLENYLIMVEEGLRFRGDLK